MRFVTLALVALLALVHAELWFGKGGVPRMVELQGKLEAQQAANEAARQRNERLAAEVSDLKEGLEMVEEKARFELGMVKPDEIFVQLSTPQALNASTALAATRRRRCSRSAFVALGRAGHLARDRRLRAWRSRWWSATSASTSSAGRWRSSARCSTSLLFWKQPAVRRGLAADLLRRGRLLGLVAVAARHRRAGGALRVRTLGAARALDRARRPAPSPGRRPASSSTASPTPTCPGGTRSRPRRACSASGCSAASTSRTGRPGSPSTSSAIGLFAYKGLWLTVVLYTLFVVDVGGRLARLAAAGRARGDGDEPRLRRSPCSAPRAPARRRWRRRSAAVLAARGARVRRRRRGPARVLRREGRTPRRDEQAAIAAEQTRRIDAAAAQRARSSSPTPPR